MVNKITNAPSDNEVISKINEIIDDKQDTLVSGTNIKTINNTSILGSGNIDVLTNSESGTNTLGILSSPDSYNWSDSVVIGVNSKVRGGSSVAIGYDARTTDYYSTAIGYKANSAYSAIQLGYGTNSTRSTFCVGFFRGTDNQSHNWELLNGTTGLIPSARISIDGTTITVNSSGQLQASGGGSSYTAGTGIDITNDVISVTSAISSGASAGSTALQPSDVVAYTANEIQTLWDSI